MGTSMEVQVCQHLRKLVAVAVFACLLWPSAFAHSLIEKSLDSKTVSSETHLRNASRRNLNWKAKSRDENRRTGASGVALEKMRGLSDSSYQARVPALFVFGDSTVDVGNNNVLRTLAQATFWPYGKDFDTHLPTGRFSDGRLSVDYLGNLISFSEQLTKSGVVMSELAANSLGLPLVPCFATADDFANGVNFASAGSGVLNDTGDIFGEYISLSKQIANFKAVQEALKAKLGAANALDLVSKSIYYISSGSNDFINNYLLPYGPHQQSDVGDFQNLVVETLGENIRTLFKLGARKIVVVSLSPLGCLPSQLFKLGSVHGECISRVNNISTGYNKLLADSVHRLRRHLPGVKLVYNDAYKAFSHITDNSDSFGIAHTNRSCCGGGPYGGSKSCFMWSNVCQDTSDYFWWDEYHPTTGVYKLIASLFWSGPMELSSPWNVETLSKL